MRRMRRRDRYASVAFVLCSSFDFGRRIVGILGGGSREWHGRGVSNSCGVNAHSDGGGSDIRTRVADCFGAGRSRCSGFPPLFLISYRLFRSSQVHDPLCCSGHLPRLIRMLSFLIRLQLLEQGMKLNPIGHKR